MTVSKEAISQGFVNPNCNKDPEAKLREQHTASAQCVIGYFVAVQSLVVVHQDTLLLKWKRQKILKARETQ